MSTGGRPDAIVIGAGIVGAACAAALSRDGLRVLVLDKAFAGAGTTSVGMGHLVVMDDSPEQLALTAMSVRQWRRLADSLGPRVEYDPCGTLWIAENDAQLEAVRAKQDVYATAGVRSELLDDHQLAEAEPNLRRGLVGALLVPGDDLGHPGDVDVAEDVPERR